MSLGDNRSKRIRYLVDQDVPLILNDLIDHLELFLIEILRHQNAILIDRHWINTKKLVLEIRKE